MSRHEDQQILAAIAHTSHTGLSLVDGLRATADEAPSSRLARRLRLLAQKIERGESIDQAWQTDEQLSVSYLPGVVSLGVRTGRLGEVLTDLITTEGERQRYWRELWNVFAYPIFILLSSIVVGFVCLQTLVTSLSAVMAETQLANSARFQALHWLAGPGWRYGVAALITLLAGMLVTRFVVGTARFRRFIDHLPLIGLLLLGPDLIEFLHRWRSLIALGLPAGTSLKMIASSVRNANLAELARQGAAASESGQPIASALRDSRGIPPIYSHLIAWGERHNQLGNALAMAIELCKGMLQLRMQCLQLVAPSVAFLLVASIIIGIVGILAEGTIAFLSLFGAGASSGQNTVTGLQLSGCVVIGGTLVWIAGVIARRHGTNNLLLMGVNIAGWILVWLGILGILYSFSGWYVLPFAIVIGLIATHRYRQSERKQLVLLIQTVARHGLPLAPTIRAFAEHRCDDVAQRALHLSYLLDQGVRFGDALDISRHSLGTSATLAARLQDGSKSFANIAGDVSEHETSLTAEWGTASALAGYATASAVVQLTMITFVVIKIAPVIEKVLQDYGSRPPAIWNFTFRIAEACAHTGWLLALAVLFLIVFSAVGLIYRLGWVRAEPFFVQPLTAPYHQAIVLRTLSQYLREGAPLPYALSQLAEHYPVPWVRNRLQMATGQVGVGIDWTDALASAGLLSSTDQGLLGVAQKLGNVPWATGELAERGFRMLSFRLRAATRLAAQLLVVIFALPTALMAVSFFSVISHLITLNL